MTNLDKLFVKQLRTTINTVTQKRHKELLGDVANRMEKLCQRIEHLETTRITPEEFGSLLSKFCTDLKSKK